MSAKEIKFGAPAPRRTRAVRGALCPERKLKGHPPVSSRCSTPGCRSVTGYGLEQPSRKPNTMTIERPMLPPREIETYEPFATQDAQFSIKTMPLNGALLRARLFLKLKSHGGSAFYPSAPNVAFPLTETKLRPVPIATSCGRLP